MTSDTRKALWQLVAIAVAVIVGYFCIRTMRFTVKALNALFVCAWSVTPWFAIRPLLRLPGLPKFIFGFLVVPPFLLISVLLLVYTVACEGFGGHWIVRDVSNVRQGSYSVHLVDDHTGGALGPVGLLLEQRMTIGPGLYVVKHLDYFSGAREGSLSAEPPDKVRVHITRGMPGSVWDQGVERVYSPKPRVYF